MFFELALLGCILQIAQAACVEQTADQQTTKCKTDKCDVTIGTDSYCSHCSLDTEFPINGVCTTDTGISTNTCATGVCTQCGSGYFLHKGGCYKKGQQPGSLICADANSVTGDCETCQAGYFNNPASTTTNDKESCIACGDVTGADNNKGVQNCAACTAPSLGQIATCTTCIDGYFAEQNGATCTQCTGDCQTCKGAATQCTSCKTNYLKITDSAGAFGECVTEDVCKQDSTHFPTTTTDSKKICTLCSDAANGGIDGCTTCTPKAAAGLAEAPSVTCSVCTPNTKKPNKAGTKCFDCQLVDCSHCSADGVCEECDGKKVSPGGSSCLTDCPENSSEQSGACVCSSGFAPSGDKCTSSSANRSGLSTGAIAGISVAAVVVVGGLVGFLCWWFICRGKA